MLPLIVLLVAQPSPTYHYVRSNVDGTLPENIVLRPRGQDIEIFKYVRPGTASALVTCRMAPSFQSPVALRSERLEGKTRRLIATLNYDRGGGFAQVFVKPSGQPLESVLIPSPAWHVFNMDLASLAMTLSNRSEASKIWFHFIEPNMSSPTPLMVDLGAFSLTRGSRVTRQGHRCREWVLRGAALGKKAGHLWMAEPGGYLVEASIPLPNHPGYRDFRMVLVARRHMTERQWVGFVARTVDP